MEAFGLPTRLPHIGIPVADKSMLERMAAGACREDDIIHNQPMLASPDMVVGVLEEFA